MQPVIFMEDHLAAVSMSDDRDSRHGFGPFVPGIELVRFNHIEDLENLFEKERRLYISFYG